MNEKKNLAIFLTDDKLYEIANASYILFGEENTERIVIDIMKFKTNREALIELKEMDLKRDMEEASLNGFNKGQEAIIKNMLTEEVPLPLIAKYTNASLKRINQIKTMML